MIGYIWAQGVVVPLLVVAVLSAGWGLLRSRRDGAGAGAALLGAATCAAVLAVPALTLARDGWPTGIDPTGPLHWAGGGWARFAATAGHSEEILLNVALFVPAGLLLVATTRRPFAVLVALVGLSTSIELLQGLLDVGNPDASDLIANSLGAVLGVAGGAVVLLVAGVRARALVVVVAVVAVAVVATGLAAPRLADRRQDEVVQRARAAFAGDTVRDLRAWDRDGTVGRRVFSLGDTYSDGRADTRGTVSVRYPTSYLGTEQCVYATWSATGVDVAPRTGGTCTRFLG